MNKKWFEGRQKQGGGVLGDYADVVKVSITEENVLISSNKKRQREEDQHLDMHKRTMETLDYRLVLKALAEECGTVKGREIVWSSMDNDVSAASNEEDIANMPLTATNLEGVHRRYDALKEMQALMDRRVNGWITPSNPKQQTKAKQLTQPNKKTKKPERKPLGRPPIEGNSFDLQPILEIIDRQEVLEGPDILEVATMLECCQDVLDWAEALEEVNAENELQQEQQEGKPKELQLKNQSFVELIRIAEAIHIDPELFSLLTNAFDDEGKLSGTTFPTIGRLRSKVRTLKQSILSSIDTLLASPSMQNKLAVESGGALTMEINGRIVIPVQQEYQNLGIVHDASRSGKTAYVEPQEVVGPTNELRQAESELRAEEARVWRELTETIIRHRGEIETAVGAVAQLDVVMGRVKLGKRLEGVVPDVRDEGVVSVLQARHPVLLLRGISDVVGSDVEIGVGDNQGLILTGPNRCD